MAYYSYNAGHPAPQPFAGLGSYYAWGSNAELYRPINGLAATDDQRLADDAARDRIERRAPLAVVGEWAQQVTDISWREVTGRSTLTLIPLRDADIPAIKAAAFGNDLPVVAVFGGREVPLERARAAFSGTPYRLGMALSVFRLDDRGAVARASFLWIAVPRGPEDKEGGAQSLDGAAKKLGGELCYLVSLPRAAGERAPGMAFERARMLGADTAPVPAVTPEIQLAPVEASITPIAWVIGGMAVAGVGWYLLAGRGG